MANREVYEAVVERVKMLTSEERRQILNLLHDMSCAQCMHFSGTGCVLASGKTPPANVIASGCKNFDYKVPF
ncbi:hypothetical protein SOI901_7 [Erwinia phage SOI901]